MPPPRAPRHEPAQSGSLGTVIVEEFVDPSESAKRANLPDLQRILRQIKAHKVAYCIVH